MGGTAKPAMGGGNLPRPSARLRLSPPDALMGTETPGEPGTCFPLPMNSYGFMFLRVSFRAACPQSPIHAGAKISAVTP